MELRERILRLVEHSGKQISEFSRFAGFKTPQAIRELIKGNTKTLSDAARIKIITAFPEINEKWLVTGKGEMLHQDTKNIDTTLNVNQSISEVSGQNAGRDINNLSVRDSETWLKELEAQRKLTEKAQKIAETTQTQLSIALAQITELMNQNKELYKQIFTCPQ